MLSSKLYLSPFNEHRSHTVPNHTTPNRDPISNGQPNKPGNKRKTMSVCGLCWVFHPLVNSREVAPSSLVYFRLLGFLFIKRPGPGILGFFGPLNPGLYCAPAEMISGIWELGHVTYYSLRSPQDQMQGGHSCCILLRYHPNICPRGHGTNILDEATSSKIANRWTGIMKDVPACSFNLYNAQALLLSSHLFLPGLHMESW